MNTSPEDTTGTLSMNVELQMGCSSPS